LKFGASAFARVTDGRDAASAEKVKKALVAKGPLAVAMPVCQSFFAYSGGIYEPTSAEGGVAGCGGVAHAVVLVGYTPDAWIIANSWGNKWGEAGYARVSRTNSVVFLDTSWVVSGKVLGKGCPKAKPCQNGGTFGADCKCQCPAGRGGADCSECNIKCENGGVKDATSCTCACKDGYFGDTCSGQLTLQWNGYDRRQRVGGFKLTYNLDEFHKTKSPHLNAVMRYSDDSYKYRCSNCGKMTVAGKSGSSELKGLRLGSGFGRPDFEHCFAVTLFLGFNEFGGSRGEVKVDLPCFYLRKNAKYPGGMCLDGGHPIFDKKHALYSMQCHTPAPPKKQCKNIIDDYNCGRWQKAGYCKSNSWVRGKCEHTCGVVC